MKRMASFVASALISASILGCYDSTKVKNVILIIGDGMQLEHEIAGSRYLTGKDQALQFHKFNYQAPCTTWDITTYNYYASLNGAPAYDPENYDPIMGYDPAKGGDFPYPLSFLDSQFDYFITHGKATDSASAATAISTGIKTVDGNICWLAGDPDNGALTMITEELRDKLGFSIGIVSTVQFAHATPACFGAHNKSRSNYPAISSEIINVMKPDVLIGAGHPTWQNSYNYITEADYNAMKKSSEYVFVERAAGVDGNCALRMTANNALKANKKLFGLFGGTGGMFDPPVPADAPGKPSFTINMENPSLAECVRQTLKVLSRDQDGFFVMFEQGDIDWANHANDYDWMIGTVYDLNEAVRAAESFVEKPGDTIDWTNTVIIVTSDHSNSYMRLDPDNRLGKGELPGNDEFSSYITYGTGNHTNEPVMLYAKGLAAKKFKDYEGKNYNGANNLIDNTDIYRFIREATGLDEIEE